MAGPIPQQPEASGPSLLTFLGLDAEQDAVYRLLVDHAEAEAAALSAAGREREDVRRHLEALVGRGLATVVRDERGERYRASPPILALGPVLEARRAALHRVEHLLTDLAERHRTAQSRDAPAPVEVLTGAATIRRRLLAVERAAREEVRALVPAVDTAVVVTHQENLDEAERELMRRGVTLRTVVERAWLENADSARSLAEGAARGQRISVVDRLPARLLIADRDVALLSVDREQGGAGEPVAVVVHRGVLLTALIALFEGYVEKGWRLHPGDHGEGGAGVPDVFPEPEPRAEPEPDGPAAGLLDAVDRKIVALLHVGLTDAAIARQLGMGHRTVQRRLQRLMESVGAATRFQLGWHAAVSGWLDRATVSSRT